MPPQMQHKMQVPLVLGLFFQMYGKSWSAILYDVLAWLSWTLLGFVGPFWALLAFPEFSLALGVACALPFLCPRNWDLLGAAGLSSAFTGVRRILRASPPAAVPLAAGFLAFVYQRRLFTSLPVGLLALHYSVSLQLVALWLLVFFLRRFSGGMCADAQVSGC